MKNRKAISFLAIVVVFLMAAMIVFEALELWGTGKAKPSEWIQKETPQALTTGVFDETGTELSSNGAVPMPTSLTFGMPKLSSNVSPAAASEIQSEGVTITATVLPETVSDKSVTFTFAFKDPSSEWARGKDVKDYLSVTAGIDNISATVKCLQAFGEQIVITASSVTPNKNGEPVRKTCTVDYLQRIKDVTAKIGDIDVVLGGYTNVTVLAGKEEGGRGGEITVEYTLADTYTVAAGSYTKTMSFTGGNHTEAPDVSEYFSYKTAPALSSRPSYKAIQYDDLEEAIGRNMYFDRRLFTDYNFVEINMVSNMTSRTLFSSLSSSDINSKYFTSRKGKKLWDISITLTSSDHSEITQNYTSALRWTKIELADYAEDMQLSAESATF